MSSVSSVMQRTKKTLMGKDNHQTPNQLSEKSKKYFSLAIWKCFHNPLGILLLIYLFTFRNFLKSPLHEKSHRRNRIYNKSQVEIIELENNSIPGTCVTVTKVLTFISLEFQEGKTKREWGQKSIQGNILDENFPNW